MFFKPGLTLCLLKALPEMLLHKNRLLFAEEAFSIKNNDTVSPVISTGIYPVKIAIMKYKVYIKNPIPDTITASGE